MHPFEWVACMGTGQCYSWRIKLLSRDTGNKFYYKKWSPSLSLSLRLMTKISMVISVNTLPVNSDHILFGPINKKRTYCLALLFICLLLLSTRMNFTCALMHMACKMQALAAPHIRRAGNWIYINWNNKTTSHQIAPFLAHSLERIPTCLNITNVHFFAASPSPWLAHICKWNNSMC